MYHDTNNEHTCTLNDILRYPKCIFRQYLIAPIFNSAQPLSGSNEFFEETAETE